MRGVPVLACRRSVIPAQVSSLRLVGRITVPVLLWVQRQPSVRVRVQLFATVLAAISLLLLYSLTVTGVLTLALLRFTDIVQCSQ